MAGKRINCRPIEGEGVVAYEIRIPVELEWEIKHQLKTSIRNVANSRTQSTDLREDVVELANTLCELLNIEPKLLLTDTYGNNPLKDVLKSDNLL